jgi:SAM-dependent methyltransferase
MLNDEVKNIWDTNAGFWDRRMGEGNDFHKTLIEPTELQLLDVKPGQHILDIACGNGQFARKMASLGAKVTAVDFSAEFIKIARSKSSADIDYRVVDVTHEDDLDTLSGLTFDSIVCTMAIMDIADIEPMFNRLPGMLKNGGRFVFSITHPCFNSGESMLVHERDDLGGEINNRYYVKTGNYLVEQSNLGIGMNGQPKPQYYFHRPVSSILRYCFNAGFILDAYEEPSFTDIENSSAIFDNVFHKIPAALVCRLRPIGR